jgi:hypothetical protein
MKNCWLPYYHVEFASSGDIKPCCKYNGSWINSLTEYQQKDRSEFETLELSKNCQECNVENSYRNIKIEMMKNLGFQEPVVPKLLSVNFFLDNVCSNSCLMCNETNSSTIGFLLKNQFKNKSNLDSLDEHLSSIQFIKILGGEPLQSPRLAILCEKLKKTSIKSINLVTSISKVKKANLEALKSVGVPISFRISLDGPADLHDWIRGSDRNDILKNFELVKQVGAITWIVSIGNYNIFALPECLDYIETLSPNKNVLPNIVNYPEECKVSHLPEEIKFKAKEKLLKYSRIPTNNYAVKTALELLDNTSTLDWAQCLKKIEHLPNLRKETNNLNYFIEKYLDI